MADTNIAPAGTSPNRHPPIVYLDTADWSRFGDVVRGRSDAATVKIFERLQHIADSGEAVFAYSLPILSELFQWDPAHPRTTMAKAEAVERLCGRNAFVWPGRVIAIEAAKAAEALHLAPATSASPLSSNAEWFPSVAGALSDIHGSFEREVEKTVALAAPLNRETRRKVQARARRLNQLEAAKSAVPEFAASHGFSEDDVQRSIIAVVAGKIDPDEGSRRLFSMIAQPTKFVDHYFVRDTGDKGLPSWMSEPGARLAASLTLSRDKIAALGVGSSDRPALAPAAKAAIADVGRSLARVGRLAADDIGLDHELIERIGRDPAALAMMPCYRVITNYLEAFMLKNLGLEDAAGHRPERSAVGDLIHALYLPHADIWRGDRRFAHLLRTEVPEYAARVASKLSDVPAMLSARAAEHCTTI
jgi:hypothetical protein